MPVQQHGSKRHDGMALSLLTLLAACGGGVGELLLVAGFLGSGGGQYFQDDNTLPGFQVADCGGEACTLTVNLEAPEFDLYATAYGVRVNGPLPNCNDVGGRVEGRNVRLGSCLTGSYVNPNEIRSDDGKTVLFHDFFPNLSEGVWVDVNDAGQRFKFTSTLAGCEITAAGKKPLQVVVTPSNYAALVFGDPNTPLQPRTVITSLTVTGGASWTGDFIGASSMRLQSGGRSIELERRDQAADCS